MGRFEDAVAPLLETLAIQSDNFQLHYHLALVRLQLGDHEGYRRACEAMIERFSSTDDPTCGRQLAWTCGLAPEAVGDLGTVVGNAQRLVNQDPKSADHLTTLSLLLYRNGDFEAATARLNEAAAAFGGQSNTSLTVIYPRLLLAMTHGRLGHQDEARRWLGEARAAIEQEPLDNMAWNRRATVELLLREAEQLIPAAA